MTIDSKAHKVPFTFRLQGVPGDSEKGIAEHFVLIGPKDEFICYGPIEAYELMERLIKLAALATRQNSLRKLQAEGIVPQPELALPQLPPELESNKSGRFTIVKDQNV